MANELVQKQKLDIESKAFENLIVRSITGSIETLRFNHIFMNYVDVENGSTLFVKYIGNKEQQRKKIINLLNKAFRYFIENENDLEKRKKLKLLRQTLAAVKTSSEMFQIVEDGLMLTEAFK